MIRQKRSSRAKTPATVDVERLAAALGVTDSRIWFAAGTVGKRAADDALELDAAAYFVDRLGLRVSVRLEPEDVWVVARAGGFAGQAGRALLPYLPGDEVLVAVPGGDLRSPAIAIVGSLSNAAFEVPADWNNDRALIDLRVPLEVRAPAVRIDSPSLFLNGRRVNFGPEGI